MIFNLPDKWSPLKSVILGRSYSERFYSSIKNNKIRSCLQKIANETEEDYLYFEQQLKSHGVEVFRPALDSSDNIANYVDVEGKIKTNLQLQNGQWVNQATNEQNIFVSATLIPKPPMTPRDSWVIVESNIIQTSIDHPSTETLVHQLDSNNSVIDSWKEFGSDMPGGNIFQIGKDIYLDKFELPKKSVGKIIKKFPNYRWHKLDIEGHADGTYHPIKPGAILSLCNIQTYSKTFPGWDVLYLPNQSWSALSEFVKVKNKNQGKWWVPEQENNDDFTYFVETWLSNWVGFVEETVFDVNCLVLDEKHVFVNNYNQQVFEFLKKHKMDPIIIPFRHRYFWDGGLHCITLELHRQGAVNDYFPERLK